MTRILIRLRYVFFLGVLGLLGYLIVAGRHVKYEQSLESFFSSDDPAVIDYKKASKAFGNDNIVFVSYDDPDLLTDDGLARLGELAENLSKKHIEAVEEVQSLDAQPPFWVLDDALITSVRLNGIPKKIALNALKAMAKGDRKVTIASTLRATTNPKAREELQKKIAAYPLLQGTLVSDNGKSTALMIRLKPMAEQDPTATVSDLRRIADDWAKRHQIGAPALVGPPVLLADGFAAIERDGRNLAAAGMLLIGLVTLSATQSLWWAIMPIVAGWAVWLAAETVLATIGLKLSLSGGPLVAQIIVLTMPAASHLAIHFRDDLRKERDRREAARSTLRAVTRPIVWCALTGAVGYGALLTSNVVPVFQFGAVLAVCTLVASLLTLAISPAAMLPPFPLEIPVRYGSRSRLGEKLNDLTHYVVDHPGRVVLIVLLLVAPLSLGMLRITYESNYINAFDKQARVVRDYHSTEARLGGIGMVSVVYPFEGTANYDGVKTLSQNDFILKSKVINGRETIARTLSLATILDPEDRLKQLPQPQADEAIQTKYALIRETPEASALNSFWDREGKQVRVIVRVSEQQEAADKSTIFDTLWNRMKNEYGPTVYVTGLSYLLNKTTEGVIDTQWKTIIWSVGSILLMLTIAFRGPKLAVLAILPTILAVTMVLGLMGWIGMRLDIATALVGSVALGLSVDDTFHCLLQYRKHRGRRDFKEAVFASYAVTGPGVLLSSLAVAAGFAVLRFSEFIPFSNFGTMVGIATLGSSLGNLVLLPALLSYGERRRSRREAEREFDEAGGGSISTTQE